MEIDFGKVFIEEMELEKFVGLWNALEKNDFECINASSSREAFNEYLNNNTAIRFAVKSTFIPNFELKFPKTDLSKYSLKNKVWVKVNNKTILTSKVELQVAYKFYLGSEKDIEDAIHLWGVFKNHLNKELFKAFAKRLGIENRIKELE